MRTAPISPLVASTVLAALLAACAPTPPLMPTSSPTSVESTATYQALRNLPAPKKPIPVAVYSYPDLTGQFKPAETVSTNSRAVTQGAVWMLVKSLKDAAGGRWFKVIQRANLDNLLKERQIIRETRGRIEKQTGQAQGPLPSLLFAGVILEGGIIGYDSNTVSGGLGARYLGIGGDVQYRQDTVTVYLNAISSQTGEILKSVMTRKTVASYGVRGSVFKFVAFQKLLEGETGYTVNEPSQIAIAQAIEHAVRSMIIEGALENLWQFEDDIAGKLEAQYYLADKEEDLLLGASADGSAQALLTDEQLEQLADVRKQRRERLKAKALADKTHAEKVRAGQANDRQQKRLAANDHRRQQTKPDGAKPASSRPSTPDAAKPNAQAERISGRQEAARMNLAALYQVVAEFRTETEQWLRAQEAAPPTATPKQLDAMVDAVRAPKTKADPAMKLTPAEHRQLSEELNSWRAKEIRFDAPPRAASDARL